METTLTLEDSVPLSESGSRFEFNSEGLLQSMYKRNVDEVYADANLRSVFGMRQHLKFSRFVTINHVAVILKLAVFATFLTMIL
jgi:hypothetical protein